MKHVILSADNELKVFLVPDFVEASFHKLCTDFHRNWKTLQVRSRNGFNEDDFVEYLNTQICKDEKCSLVEVLGWDYKRKNWPEKYRDCPHYNF